MSATKVLSPEVPISPYFGKKLTPWQHLAISGFWFATNVMWGALLVILLPSEIKNLAPHYRPQALGLFTALGAIVALVVPLIVGPISDRCTAKLGRRKPFIVGGLIVNLCGLAMMALIAANSSPIASSDLKSTLQIFGVLLSSGGYLGYLGGFVLVQLGNNIATAAYMGFVPDLIPEDQRGVASGYMAMMSQIGTLVGAVAIGILLGHASELIKYGFLGTLLAGIGVFTIFGVRENQHICPAEKVLWRSYFINIFKDLKLSPDFLWVWITRFLVMLGFYAIEPFINYYLTDVIKFEDPGPPAAKLIGVILIMSSISGFAGGALSDRIGRKRVVYISTGMMAVVVVGFTFCSTFLGALLIGCLFGIAFGAYVSVDWALGTDVLPNKADAGKDMAVWHIAMTLPQSISPLVAGALIGAFAIAPTVVIGESIPHYGVMGYGLVFGLCSICFIFGAFLLRNVKGST